MTDKPKRKHVEQGFWGRLTDTIFLAKPFEYIVDWSPEECAKHVGNFAKPKAGYSDNWSRDVKLHETDSGNYDFEIRNVYYSRNPYVGVEAKGCILKASQLERTMVRGKVRLGLGYHIGLPIFMLIGGFLLFLAIGYVSTHNLELWTRALSPFLQMCGFVFIILEAGSFYAGAIDRNKLYDLIYNTFSPDTKKHDG